MSISPSAERALKIAERAGWSTPYLGVRVPDPLGPKRGTVDVEAIFTAGDAPPHWGNLALVIHGTTDRESVWESRASMIPSKGILLSRDRDCLWFAEGSESTRVSWANVGNVLELHREEVFSPRAVALYRRGQLTLGDFEDRPGPLSYALRVRAQMEKVAREAFRTATGIEAALPRGASRQVVAQVVLAYMGARVFQDKGVVKAGVNPNDPEAVVRAAVNAGNGFLRETLRVINTLQLESLQAMGAALGVRSSFALADHTDIGRLYESLQDELDAGGPDLERHYTPLGLAERMLSALPIERLRPERRLVYDPAAGSGTLLMASTMRLRGLCDTVLPLRESVAGNDTDRFASLITHLRYQLLQATEGGRAEPWSPRSFTQYDIREIEDKHLPFNPGVMVANPPFTEEGGVQMASAFVDRFVKLLSPGTQFGLILPDSFWRGRGQGTAQARDALISRSRLFEVWEVPEGVVGLRARQAVCVLIGELSHQADRSWPFISRSVTSRKREVVEAARHRGFVGVARFGESGPTQAAPVAPDYLRLSDACEVRSGVQPRPAVRYLQQPPVDGPAWPAWVPPPEYRPADGWYRLPAQPREMLWVDPGSVGASADRIDLLLSQKVVARRVSNRDSRTPLAPLVDLEGCLPDSNYFALVFREEHLPPSWKNCPTELRLGSLAALLCSRTAQAILSSQRSARFLPKSSLEAFLLPRSLKTEFLTLVADAMALNRGAAPIPPKLTERIDQQVDSMLGYSAPRVLPSLDAQLAEFSQLTPGREAVGQVLGYDRAGEKVLLYLSGFDEPEALVTLPADLPGWALDGVPFDVNVPCGSRTVEEAASGWNLVGFRHTARPYLTPADLEREWGTSI